jgi:cytochrome c biogenesis protein ResB
VEEVVVEAAGVAAAIGCLGIAVFQVALAAGAPLGRAAWGGVHERLPRNLRVASAAVAVVWVLAALTVLAAAGFQASPIPASVADWATWVLAALLLVGAVMNLLSRSRLERIVWGPVALVLAGLTAIVASGA